MIDQDILITWGAAFKKYQKNEMVFQEGQEARFYFQIIEGGVKMCSSSASGDKEIIQGIFYSGQCFGEPPLFVQEVYPSTARATEDSIIAKLSKDRFFSLLREYPEIHFDITRCLARRLHNKALAIGNFINDSPELRISNFLEWYKKNQKMSPDPTVIPLTRQEIANYTGLRVETVIRALRKMADDGKIQIIHRKIIW
jgi:CRP/FNR family transcriptional regulator